MKTKITIFLFLLSFQTLTAQDKKRTAYPFFRGNIHFTFAINENYRLFEPDDNEYLLDFSAIFLRAGFGYQFNRRWNSSVNFGTDFHTRLSIQTIPIYLNLQYNISENEGDAFFVNSSIGKLWKPSSNFETGQYYGLGIGGLIKGDGRTAIEIRLDLHRKKIAGFYIENLDSISLAIGLRLN